MDAIRDIYNGSLYKYGSNNRGYILFQKFVPENTYDIRVTIIGERGIIFRRKVREDDFRASGSGKISYEVSPEDIQAIPKARKVTEKIGSQTMAFDFIYDKGILKIIEMSYGFVSKAVYDAPGWYDEHMVFHKEKTDVHKLVIENLLKDCGKK